MVSLAMKKLRERFPRTGAARLVTYIEKKEQKPSPPATFKQRVKAAKLHLPVSVVKKIDEKVVAKKHVVSKPSVAPDKSVSKTESDFKTRVKAAKMHLPVSVVKKIDEKVASKKELISSEPPTYAQALGELSTARTSVSQSIDLLRDPRTYYDPVKNVVVYDILKASDPLHQIFTATKIKEMEGVQSKLVTSEFDVVRFQREGYQIRETESGGYEFFKTPEQIKQELISSKKEELREWYAKGPVERFAHVWSMGIISFEDPLSIRSTMHMAWGMITGTQEEQQEKILDIKARASIDIDKALEEGIGSYVLKVATGPMAMVGLSFVGGATVSAGSKLATGYLTAKGAYHAVNIVKGVEIAAGLGFGALAGKDVIETYQDEGAIAAAARASFYGILFGSAAAGYKSVDSGKWIAKGEDKFFKRHPGALRTSWGVEGEQVLTIGEIKGFTSRGTPTEGTKLSLSDITMWKQGPGAKQLFIRFPGSKDVFFGPKIKGIGALKSSVRGGRVEPAVTVSDGGLVIDAGGGTRTVPLTKGEALSFVTGRSGQIGKHIFSFRRLDWEMSKMLTAKEGGALGGFTKTIQKTVPTSVFDIPVVSPVFGVTPGLTIPIVIPISQQDLLFETEIETVKTGDLGEIPVFGTEFGQRKRTGAVRTSSEILDVGLATEDIQVQSPVLDVDIIKDADIIEKPDVVDVLFDFAVTDIPEPAAEKIWFRKYTPGFIGFPLPKGMGDAGGTDLGFGWVDPFARERKHKVKDILKEMEEMF